MKIGIWVGIMQGLNYNAGWVGVTPPSLTNANHRLSSQRNLRSAV